MQRAVALFGNPSSLHRHGRRAAEALAGARAVVAGFIGARPEQVVFTASGSESNTMAVLRLAEAYPKREHIITTPIEHKSILEACQVLKRQGYRITLVPVDGNGVVNPDDITRALSSDTLLVSVMHANNEVGSIEPIAKIGREIRRWRRAKGSQAPFFHTDACQTAAYMPLDVHQLEVDLLTFNSSKVYGPRGVGVLYVRSGLSLLPQIYGGAHEQGIRAGTENVPAIVGFAAALNDIRADEGKKISRLRDRAIAGLLKSVDDARLIGPEGDDRFPNNISIAVPGVQGEQMVLELDMHGISVSTGAACTSHETEPSHVIRALKVPPAYQQAIRISLGRTTTRSDIDRLVEVFPKAVAKIRRRNAL